MCRFCYDVRHLLLLVFAVSAVLSYARLGILAILFAPVLLAPFGMLMMVLGGLWRIDVSGDKRRLSVESIAAIVVALLVVSIELFRRI